MSEQGANAVEPGRIMSASVADHTSDCTDVECVCPDDVVWRRLLGDDDPCAPGKDWAAAAFNHESIEFGGFR